jgi:hypothetical protein
LLTYGFENVGEENELELTNWHVHIRYLRSVWFMALAADSTKKMAHAKRPHTVWFLANFLVLPSQIVAKYLANPGWRNPMRNNWLAKVCRAGVGIMGMFGSCPV